MAHETQSSDMTVPQWAGGRREVLYDRTLSLSHEASLDVVLIPRTWAP